MSMEPGDAVGVVKGVGPAVALKLALLGVKTVNQLVHNYPRRYDDYSEITPIAKLQPGHITIQAEIKQLHGRYVRRGMHITEAIATDKTGSVRLVWFNQSYRAANLKTGQEYYISGVFELRNKRLAIASPSVELVSDFPVNTARIIPIYRETKGLTSRQIRQYIFTCLSLVERLPETLPAWLVKQQKLIPHSQAVAAMHFPANGKLLEQAKQRLGFEEVFGLSLASLTVKKQLIGEKAPAVPFTASVAQNFVKKLPFDLTAGQKRVAWQIFQDMESTEPMNRLIEGDVGSGKTVVAAMAAVMVLHHGKVTGNGHQVALMAPTELLARQHAETLYKLLEPIGYHTTIGLLVGGMKQAQKQFARQKIQDGQIKFMIGTQALIQESVDMRALELIIIDEQHRYGVDQRKELMRKAGHMPHVLNLTATPIPRSLALTLYGELEVSILSEKPANRKPIITKITSPNSRAALYKEIDVELAVGRQLFAVCPVIQDSETIKATSAEQLYEQFSKKDFKHRRVGLLHGRMKPAEKNDIMAAFVRHDLDILVSTTVIEVGVDVPNASVMLIEGADRFGLAQAHQLRGRVGRGEDQGYCYLMMSDSKAPNQRLRALESSNDGFRLAELDLELRGPGAIYGTSQHGELDLRIAKLTDIHLITAARKAAESFLDKNEDLTKYPELHRQVMRYQTVTKLN
jgi:ATP-dependent DNA helicase RecG